MEYAAYHPNTVFVLSGGQGDDEDVTEASAMYRYMKSRGVPDYQLLLEESSRSTYENMVYSKMLITERERIRRATLRAAMAESGYLLPPDEEIVIRVRDSHQQFPRTPRQRDRPPRRSPQRQRHLRKVGSRAVCTFLRERVFCDIKRQICGEYVTKGIKVRLSTQACLQERV